MEALKITQMQINEKSRIVWTTSRNFGVNQRPQPDVPISEPSFVLGLQLQVYNLTLMRFPQSLAGQDLTQHLSLLRAARACIDVTPPYTSRQDAKDGFAWKQKNK